VIPELAAGDECRFDQFSRLFRHPTPGRLTPGRARFAPVPQFVTAGGIFTNGVSVEMAGNSPVAEIRYTLDVPRPPPRSILYTGPIVLSVGSTTVRARIWAETLPSDTVSQSYTILDTDSPLSVPICRS